MGLDTRAGRKGRTCNLDWKIHPSIDHRWILPLADVLAPANEKKHGPNSPSGTPESTSDTCDPPP